MHPRLFFQVLACLVFSVLISSCESLPSPEISATSTESLIKTPVEITESNLTETPIPACISLSSIELTIDILSKDSIHIKITGLVPYEPVYIILSSTNDGQKKDIGCCSGKFADENGVYEYAVGLRGPGSDLEFTDWQVRVVHSRGSTCEKFSIP